MQSLPQCNCREVAAARPSVQQRPQRLVCRSAAREAQQQQQQQQRQQLTSLPLLAAGLAAAVLVGASPAEAKVKFQQPEKPARQLFQRDPNAPKPATPEAPAKSSGGGFSLPSFSAPSLPNLPAGPKEAAGGIDARTVALPGAVAGIVGLGFGLTKIDPGFGKVLKETVIKDSGEYAGYEEVLKNGADAIGRPAGGRLGGGTKRMKAKPAAKKQKGGKGGGGGGLLDGLLGKK